MAPLTSARITQCDVCGPSSRCNCRYFQSIGSGSPQVGLVDPTWFGRRGCLYILGFNGSGTGGRLHHRPLQRHLARPIIFPELVGRPTARPSPIPTFCTSMPGGLPSRYYRGAVRPSGHQLWVFNGGTFSGSPSGPLKADRRLHLRGMSGNLLHPVGEGFDESVRCVLQVGHRNQQTVVDGQARDALLAQ